MIEKAKVVVYSRRGCHLCEQMLEALGPLIRGRADLMVVDVDERVDWQERYGLRVPVLDVGGHTVCEYTLDREAFLTALDRVSGTPQR